MTKLEELLKNEKVQWKKLGEIGKFYGGVSGKSKGDFVDGNSKFITYKNVFFNPETRLDMDDRIKIYPNERQNTLQLGDIIFTGSSEKYEECGMSSVIVENLESKVYLNSFCFFFRLNDSSILLPYFSKHLFRSIFIREKIIKTASGVTRFNVSKKLMEKIEIPIPSIETQNKIVTILDKFTNYVTELQAELQARNKQYDYYKNKLLSEEYLNKISDKIYSSDRIFKVKYIELENIVKIKNGKDWKSLGKGKIPVYGSGGKMNIFVDKYSYNKPTVLIPRKGSIENIFYLEEPFWNVDTIFYTEINDKEMIPKYFYYFMENFNIKVLSNDSTRPSLTQSILNKIKILLPPLEIQEKIVVVLDKFQELIQDAQGLLPQEIEQRQKQYEYYREKLLTFAQECDKHTHTHTHTHTIISNRFFTLLREGQNLVGLSQDDEMQWKTLGEIGNFTNGTGMPKTMFEAEGEIGAIHYGHIYTKYNKFVYEPLVKVGRENAQKLKKVEKGDLVIAKTSENLEDVMKTVAYLGEDEAVTGGHAAIFKHGQNPKFLSYLFNSSEYVLKQKNKLARGVKVIEISTSDMEKIKIPLPSLEVQEHVVSILDKFEELVNDIHHGLPREIELRQKQYEYYREKLLNFSKDDL